MNHAANSTSGNSASRRATALLIVNKHSGASGVTLDQLAGRFGRADVEVSTFSPENPGEMEDIIRTMGADADFIVLGGGDGTINHAAPALLAADRPVGILPMGTANDLARTLGIPTDPGQAISVILDRHTRRIDVGMVNGRPFFNVSSIGFSVEVARFHRGDRKRFLGLLSYPISWLGAWRAHRPFRATITCDDKVRICRCTQLAVGNGRHYGGGLTIAEDSEIDDGWLTVYYLKPLSLWGWIRLLPSLRFGTLKQRPEAELTRAAVVQIATNKPKQINVDGELAGKTPATFHLLPKALSVFVPAPKSS